MLRIVTPQKEWDSRRRAFARLKSGMLISMFVDPDEVGIPVNQYFLTRERVSETSWSLLPLDPENNLEIVGSNSNQRTRFVTKEFREMCGLQILVQV
jgi:hypothetical protein